jgi:hypothetical protein
MSLPGQTPEEVEALVPPALPARKGKVKLVQRAGGGDGPGGVGAKALAGVVPPGKKASDAFTVHRLASLAHMLDTYVALSKTQMEFKKKLLGDHGTSWAHQHYHVFERWTRAHVMVTTAVLGLLGLLQLSLMFIWLDKQKISASNPFQAGLIGYGYMLIAPLCIVTAAIGGYGAHKIKQDLQKHVHGDGAGSMHNVLELKEDKGQEEWLSHRLLLVSVAGSAGWCRARVG